MATPQMMDFSPARAALNWWNGGSHAIFGEPWGGISETTRPTPEERAASGARVRIPYNASLGSQNPAGAVGAPVQSEILRALLAEPPTPAPPPANSTDAAVAPWVARGGAATDFYNPDRGPAKPLVGEQIGPVRMMPPGVAEALKNSKTPWTDLGGSNADFYDPESPKEMARQQTAQQMAKIRQINQMYAAPSWSAIEQQMQNSAMGYAPEFQAAFLHDMAQRANVRLGAAAKAIGELLGQDVGMHQADVQGQNAALSNAADLNALQQQIAYKMYERGELPPEIMKQLRDMLLSRIMVNF